MDAFDVAFNPYVPQPTAVEIRHALQGTLLEWMQKYHNVSDVDVNTSSPVPSEGQCILSQKEAILQEDARLATRFLIATAHINEDIPPPILLRKFIDEESDMTESLLMEKRILLWLYYNTEHISQCTMARNIVEIARKWHPCVYSQEYRVKWELDAMNELHSSIRDLEILGLTNTMQQGPRFECAEPSVPNDDDVLQDDDPN